MVDFLVAWMQALCVLGLVCGAYYSLTYRRERRSDRVPRRQDPVAAHIRDVTNEAMPHAHS
jgi:hypothetical protein